MEQMNVLRLIGNTPIVKLPNENIYLKMEKFNPGGSIKDRAALGMVEDAEARGLLRASGVIVEPTSGNTGIALALIGRLKGYKVIITMPETMSIERRTIIAAHGATLILTDGTLGMKGAIARASELLADHKGYFMPDQFNNPANPAIHYRTTGAEILRQLGDLDGFVAGVGTGGTISGVSRRLKESRPEIRTVGVEPVKSPVISGGSPSPHKIQGIGAGFIPGTYSGEYVDEIITVTDEEAFAATVEVSGAIGMLVGISTGANVAAARKLAERIGSDKKILTISPDGGEKYLSMVKYQ